MRNLEQTFRRGIHVGAAALVLLAAAGCGDAFGPFAVVGPQEIEPRTVWFEWYQDLEQCTQVDGRFTNITWFRAEEIVNRQTQESRAGLWRAPHEIYLRKGRQASERTVRHEMVHDLLSLRDPKHTHSHPAFQRCLEGG